MVRPIVIGCYLFAGAVSAETPKAMEQLRSLGPGQLEIEIPADPVGNDAAAPGSPAPRDRLTPAELDRLARLAQAIHKRVSQREQVAGGQERLPRAEAVADAKALRILSVQGPIELDGSLEFEGVELIYQEPGPQGRRYVFGIFSDGQIMPSVTMQQGYVATSELLSLPRMQALLEEELRFWLALCGLDLGCLKLKYPA